MTLGVVVGKLPKTRGALVLQQLEAVHPGAGLNTHTYSSPRDR